MVTLTAIMKIDQRLNSRSKKIEGFHKVVWGVRDGTLDWRNRVGMWLTAVRFAHLLDTKLGIEKCKESSLPFVLRNF